MIGIATNAVFGIKNPYKNKECLAYYSYNGSIWENEDYRNGGRTVFEEEVISIRVDANSWLLQLFLSR